MGSRSTLSGMEVPIIGIDSLRWIDVSVPSSDSSAASDSTPFAPLTEDAASGFIFDDPPTYLIWRIHKSLPHALEIIELSSYQECPRIGLRIIFPDALSPFVFICKDESIYTTGDSYLLYVITVTGAAYLLKLRNISTYVSCSVFPQNELIEFNMQPYRNQGEITAVAATAECLLVGRSDGSVGCFELCMLDQNPTGIVHELRDDSGIGRLWGFMSSKEDDPPITPMSILIITAAIAEPRGANKTIGAKWSRMVGAVQDLVILEMHGRKLVFVLHVDGIIRAWDLLGHSRVFSHTISASTLAGATSVKLWVGQANHETSMIPLAILYRHHLEDSMETIYLFNLHFNLGDRINLLPEASFQEIPLKEGGLIDVKITSNKIWILKQDGLMLLNLFDTNVDVEEAHCYALQEGFVADQLFQSSEHSPDDLLWIAHSVFSYTKDQIVPFVSSIFLRRLLHPGVYNNTVLRATLEDYNKHWTDSEFQSLTVDGIKKEILSVIEHQGATESPTSISYGWKVFCTRYFHHWCKNSAPYGLLVESSTEVVCLIRKQSISLFRCLEDIELLSYGSFNEVGDVASSWFGLSDGDLEREILFEILQCCSNVSQQLGKAASAIFYESLVHEGAISSEEIVPRLVKILETGYGSSVSALHLSDLGTDIAWEKKLTNHKILRKFSVDMLLSLHALCNKANTWSLVLNVIESYLKFLVPRKIVQKFDSEVIFNIKTSILVQATSQVAKVMFESAFDILLLLSYLVSTSEQIHMTHEEVSRIQLELVPMIQEIITEWLIIHFLGTTPSECPAMEDFSSQLSSLQIDGNFDRRSWNEKLGKCDFTLSFILLLNNRISSADQSHLSLRCLPDPENCISSVRDFTSWVIWGRGGSGEESPAFFRHSTELASVLLRHGQYDAAEVLLTIVDSHSRKEKTSASIQDTDGEWCTLFHLLGCCVLARAHFGLHGILKERKVCEAIRWFFRASAGQGAPEALLTLTRETGLPHLGFTDCASAAAWKLQYYEWAMQIFEQYNISEGACQFALAALEQVDEALREKDVLTESATTIKGRLWANVFKFTLDLNRLYDAYCAIITNPDVESKYVCLRRFIIVLYERGALKIFCDGELPFVGLSEKVEQELFWKAGRSDVLVKPNPYKILYAFEMHRHNWRRAASYIYLYSAHLRAEVTMKDHPHQSVGLQERLNALSAAINALQLVNPAHAWIDPLLEGNSLFDEHHPSKRAKRTVEEQTAGDTIQSQRVRTYVDIEKLEKEFVLTSAEYMLSLANVKWVNSGLHKLPSDLVDLLVQTNLYDMAFTVLLKFWKGSGLNRELERVFCTMSLKCCPNNLGSSLVGSDFRKHGLLLTSSKDEAVIHGSPDAGPSSQYSKGNSQWEILELYLEKYKSFHARLPVIVAETLLRIDPQIELPLWLVHMFKGGGRENTWGMTGQESSPACLFRIYVDYGRYTEATNLLLEFIESVATVRPAEIINRKRPSAVWFPYTTIERLWCQLNESIRLGHMVDQCEKLKKLLHGALQRHLKLLKVDSDDVLSSAMSEEN